MVWISRSGSASRLRSLKTLPTKCTPVYSLRVSAQIVNNLSFAFFISKLMIDGYVMFEFCCGCSFLEGIFCLQPGSYQKMYRKVHSLQT